MKGIRIRDVLRPRLAERFPTRKLRPGQFPNTVGSFVAEHPAIGDVEITDDESEATVYIGEITHGHFNPYDASLSPEQVADMVTDDVVEFLEDLFADRVLLWAMPGGKRGGWQRPFDGTVQPDLPSEANVFVWSGPLKKRTESNRG